jgi:hypothetical protein
LERNGAGYPLGSPRRSFILSGAIILAALLYGLGVHALTVVVRDHGPVWGSVSLRGNGAIVVPLVLGLLGIGACVWFCGRQRAWFAMAVGPFALLVGLFVIAGGF